MKIHISSLLETATNINYIKNNNFNLISIRDSSPSEYNKNLYNIIDSSGIENLLVINFDDILEFIPNREEKPPQEEDIKIILEWAKQRTNRDFIVQCTGGISRSSAVAILIKCSENPDKALKVINPIYHSPNEKILELGDKLLNTNIKNPTKELLTQHNEEYLKSKDIF